MGTRVPVIFDCDPGVDDAIALVLAHGSGRIDIRAVTVVAGNRILPVVLKNAKKVLHLLGVHPRVAAGAAKPLSRPLLTADVHGEGGLGDCELEEPPWSEEGCGAIELMRSVLLESPAPMPIIATGPLTNVAELLDKHPEVKPKISRMFIMGGAVEVRGNVTEYAEFNAIVDPEAAAIVFESGVPITLAPLDVTMRALFMPDDAQTLVAQAGPRLGPVTQTVKRLVDFFHVAETVCGGAAMHDPSAVGSLLAPELFTMREMRIVVETKDPAKAGMTRAVEGPPNATVCVDVRRVEFIRLIQEACWALDAK